MKKVAFKDVAVGQRFYLPGDIEAPESVFHCTKCDQTEFRIATNADSWKKSVKLICRNVDDCKYWIDEDLT